MALFTPTERAEFANSQPLTADTLVELIATHSAVIVMAPRTGPGCSPGSGTTWRPARRPRRGQFQLPMVTSVIRAVALA